MFDNFHARVRRHTGPLCVYRIYENSVSSSLSRLSRFWGLRVVAGDFPTILKSGVCDIKHLLRRRFYVWYPIKWTSYSVILILSLRVSPCRHTARRQRGGSRRCGRSNSAPRDGATACLCGYSSD